jgi:hypothetical protein
MFLLGILGSAFAGYLAGQMLIQLLGILGIGIIGTGMGIGIGIIGSGWGVGVGTCLIPLGIGIGIGISAKLLGGLLGGLAAGAGAYQLCK